ncbi:SRPBCC family protein [Nocardioides sp.]|uniref:SRPBCC family protein n=1 Tax=Nocardioides sp. TaxID=35761 RepID=UPI002B642708|nr:SRPBCC family protein [Nocardioides sp.]HSX66559.1 SRPBCC family protein [Nocardioides sp.]
MRTFALQPVADRDFEVGQPFTHRFTVRTKRSASEVFAELHGDRPLHWCKGIRRVTWTSPGPHAAGATRTVALANGLVVHERYFLWDDATRVTAFAVESANLPLFRRFGERYTVTPTADGGSEFLWEFLAEPKVPGPLKGAVLSLVKRLDLAKLERDTRAYFS